MFDGMAATRGSTEELRGKGMPTGDLRMRQQIVGYKKGVVNTSDGLDWLPSRHTGKH
jgi:hypothetical protein